MRVVRRISGVRPVDGAGLLAAAVVEERRRGPGSEKRTRFLGLGFGVRVDGFVRWD